MARLAEHKHLVALLRKAGSGVVGLLHVRAGGIHHMQAEGLGVLDDLGHHTVAANDERGRGRRLTHVFDGVDAATRKVAHDDGVVDEGPKRADRTALGDAVLNDVQGALHAVTGAGKTCGLNLGHVGPFPYGGAHYFEIWERSSPRMA